MTKSFEHLFGLPVAWDDIQAGTTFMHCECTFIKADDITAVLCVPCETAPEGIKGAQYIIEPDQTATPL